jgi:pimeloyl-ACP methyl ester carboxylesterase
MFDYPILYQEGEHLECGYLIVPERHEQPDGPTIRLAVAIIKSQVPDPEPDPVVVAQGGPGGSTIDTFATILLLAPFFGTNRDIVLFDQRGTLYSEPALICREQYDLIDQTLEQHLQPDELTQLSLEADKACRERLVDEGVDLAAYNSLENAADVEALRQALGYDQINLYGVSYGTLLAFHVMRDYAEGLRSVILDAVVPPQTNFITEVPWAMDRAFSTLFQSCTATPECNAAYPNLEEVFFQLVEETRQQPLTIPLKDPESGRTYQAVFDGDALIGTLFQLLYATEFIPGLPKLIYDLKEGNTEFLSLVLPLFVFDRTISTGMYNSVICAEDADFTAEDLPDQGLSPVLAENGKQSAKALLATCEVWQVPELGPEIDAPVTSSVPTLVLSGQFDPITPPAFANVAAETLSHSYVYTFPNVGHSAAGANPCANRIIQDFLDNPEVEPRTACLDNLPQEPSFITEDDLVSTNVLASWLLAIEQGNAGRLLLFFGLLLGCLFLLLSAWLVWPLEYLIRRIRQLPHRPQPRLAHLSRGIALFTGLVAVIFVVGLVIVLVLTIADEQLLLFGVPRITAPLFIVPLFIALLTMGMLIATGLAWGKGYWVLWQRLYYTLLTLMAVGFTFLLIQSGLMTVLL